MIAEVRKYPEGTNLKNGVHYAPVQGGSPTLGETARGGLALSEGKEYNNYRMKKHPLTIKSSGSRHGGTADFLR